ncbi:putative phage abortive infection protein [Acinetobacter baumannii]|nr:putative phage abortive infection protein [Acinetobacter baumannii]
MQENENNSNKDLEKIDQDINFHRIIIFLIIIAVVFFYLIMKDIDVKDAAQHWGPVGDFFGGILNPIFALFAFYWLTYSVRLQIKELKETREELKKAATAQVESARHQESIAALENENVITQKELLALQEKTLISQQEANKSQQNQIAIQNFESLFFELIKTKNEALNTIRVRDETLGKKYNYDGVNAVIYLLENLKQFDSTNRRDEEWYDYYKDYMKDMLSSYIGIVNQILNLLIDSKNNLKTSWSYIKIFKATLSRVELEILFLSGFFYENLKNNIEKTELFENLNSNFNILNSRSNILTKNAFFYKKEAFDGNDFWMDYFGCFEECNYEGVDIIQLEKNCETLNNNFVLHRFDDSYTGITIAKDQVDQILRDELNDLLTKIEESGKSKADLLIEQTFELSTGKDLIKYNELKDIVISNELYFIVKYHCNRFTLEKYKNQ